MSLGYYKSMLQISEVSIQCKKIDKFFTFFRKFTILRRCARLPTIGDCPFFGKLYVEWEDLQGVYQPGKLRENFEYCCFVLTLVKFMCSVN